MWRLFCAHGQLFANIFDLNVDVDVDDDTALQIIIKVFMMKDNFTIISITNKKQLSRLFKIQSENAIGTVTEVIVLKTKVVLKNVFSLMFFLSLLQACFNWISFR